MPQFEVIYQEFPINFVARAKSRSRSFKLKWTKQNERGYDGPYQMFPEIYEFDGKEYRRRKDLEPDSPYLLSKNYKWDVGRGIKHRPLDPNKKYKAIIYLRYISGENFAIFQLTDCLCYITEQQFQNLRLKAEKICLEQCGGLARMQPFTHFYRSDKNTDNVVGEQFVLTPNQKLAIQGHRVPGVECLPGIFFFAQDYEPRVNSFGKKYVKYPIKCLIANPEEFDFFFMDIKCYNYRSHYITIAVAKKESDEHKYCLKRLGSPLDKYDNPFLRINNNGEYFVPGHIDDGRHSDCFIEIFFLQKGQLTFNRKDVIILNPNPNKPCGRKSVPNNDCPKCCHLSPPEGHPEKKELPPEQPSNSFYNAHSYPSTPEPEGDEEEDY